MAQNATSSPARTLPKKTAAVRASKYDAAEIALIGNNSPSRAPSPSVRPLSANNNIGNLPLNKPVQGIQHLSAYVLSTHDHSKIFSKVRPTHNTNRKSTSIATQVAKPKKSTHKNHLLKTLQGLRFVSRITQPEPSLIEAKTVFLPNKKCHENRKTLVLDLDETLVHCVGNSTAEVPLSIVLQTGEVVDIGVNIRPFVRELLVSANTDFEVIVFTASHKVYADKVLDYLDPTGSLIHHRLYRKHCLMTEKMYVKDLRILGNKELKNIVIVDNAVHSFAYQLDNGIPIMSWYDDNNDEELLKLIDYLRFISKVADVREVNREVFNLRKFYSQCVNRENRSINKENIQ